MTAPSERKPAWLKVRAPGGGRYPELKRTMRRLELNTVCEEARCPNVAECWAYGTATIMLLGDTCTRNCRFCAVDSGNPKGAVDPREPEHTARAIGKIGLTYVVLTMVDRDDLLDGGAEHIARTIRALRTQSPKLLIEALVGDFSQRRDDIHRVVDAEPDVFAHNVEVVRELSDSMRDRRCSHEQSLNVLRIAKERAPERLVKSSIMVGVGETDEQVVSTLSELRSVGVDMVTLGQYLRPTSRHAPVRRFVPPDTFSQYKQEALAKGFRFVASGPMVRSSYHAVEGFLQANRSS